MSCLNITINSSYDPQLHKQMWYYIYILIGMSVYYMIINLKHIKLIEKIYPPMFDFIDKFNGCITVDDTKSVSIYYLSYFIVFIILYASILVYIYVNLKNGLFKTLGDGVYIFLLLFAYLVMIINLLYYYDDCFKPIEDIVGNNCNIPSCPDPKKPYYNLSQSKCVSKTKTTPKPTPSGPTTTPSPSGPTPLPTAPKLDASISSSKQIDSQEEPSTTSKSYIASGIFSQINKQDVKNDLVNNASSIFKNTRSFLSTENLQDAVNYPSSFFSTKNSQDTVNNQEGFTDEYNIVYTDIFERANFLMDKLYKLSNIYSIN